MILACTVFAWSTRVTDRQTDRQTELRWLRRAIAVLAVARKNRANNDYFLESSRGSLGTRRGSPLVRGPQFENRCSRVIVLVCQWLCPCWNIRLSDCRWQSFPMLLSQAVYVAFCKSFNDSFPRFDEHFKDGVVNTLHEWITGMHTVILHILLCCALFVVMI